MIEKVARAIRAHRSARGLSLDQLATRAGLSKGAVVAVESGSGNPNLATLVRLADALGVSVSSLVQDDDPPAVQVVDPDAIPPLWRGLRGGTATLALTTAGPSPVEVWHWSLPAGERYDSQPHPAGIIETVTVTCGHATLVVAGTRHRLAPNAVATFAADVEHSYLGDEPAGAALLMTVHLPRTPSKRS